MKVKYLRMMFGIVLSFVIILSSVFNTFADTTQIGATEGDNSEAIIDETFFVQEAEEEKNYCNAKLTDDFEDNTVLLLMNRETSLALKEYQLADFSEIQAYSVENPIYNRMIGQKVKGFIDAERTLVKSKLKESYCLSEEEANKIINDTVLSVNARHNISLEEKQKVCSIISKHGIDFIGLKEEIKSDIDSLYSEYAIKENNVKYYKQCVEIKLSIHSKQNVLNTIKALEKRNDIYCAQPNYFLKLAAIPNDTKYSDQSTVANLIKLPQAWNNTTGSANIKVGIIDSGIKRAHSDLTANVSNSLYFADNGINALQDSDGHGTQIAGIIGAVGNNNNGIAGTCWDVDLISLRAVNQTAINNCTNCFSNALIAQAIYYAQDNNIDIINCSFSSNTSAPYINTAIANYTNGLLVCAAGNENVNNDAPGSNHSYPSDYTYDNIISVACTNNYDELVVINSNSGSNYGSSSVDLAAPGFNITTTNNSNNPSEYYVSSYWGTSYSTAFVSGAAALIKSEYPTMEPYAVKAAILDGVDDVNGLHNKVKTGGRLNVYKALQKADRTYTVKYNKNDGIGNTMEDSIITYGVPQNLRLNTYTKRGKNKFNGWTAHRQSDNKWLYTNGNNNGWYMEDQQPNGYYLKHYSNGAQIAATTRVDNDIVTLYAQWRKYNYRIYYCENSNPNSKLDETTAAYDQYCSLNYDETVVLGYKPLGWYAERASDHYHYYSNGANYVWSLSTSPPEGYTEYMIPANSSAYKWSEIDGDIIYLSGVWTPKQYTASFNNNSGNGYLAPVTVYCNQSIIIPENTFYRNGYCLEGWKACCDGDWYCIDSNGEYDWRQNGNPDPNAGYTVVEFFDREDIQILAYEDNETIELIAQWRSKASITKGDVNQDGNITIQDVTLIQKYLAMIVTFNDIQKYAADINNDGTVTIDDATILQTMI